MALPSFMKHIHMLEDKRMDPDPQGGPGADVRDRERSRSPRSRLARRSNSALWEGRTDRLEQFATEHTVTTAKDTPQ